MALWTADSVHRANNLAQMATALGHAAQRLPTQPYLPGFEPSLNALADAYSELGRISADLAPVVCEELLYRVAGGLVAVFGGGPRKVALHFASDNLSLPPDQRRALILIASELVINALKYAFPNSKSGTIHVSLRVDGDMAELVVEDDGVGLAELEVAGTGTGLLVEFGALLGATFGRTSDGGGLRVTVRFSTVGCRGSDRSDGLSATPLLRANDGKAADDAPISVHRAGIDHMGHVNDALYLSWGQEVVVRHWTRLASRLTRGLNWTVAL